MTPIVRTPERTVSKIILNQNLTRQKIQYYLPEGSTSRANVNDSTVATSTLAGKTHLAKKFNCNID